MNQTNWKIQEIIDRLANHPKTYGECGFVRPCYNISCYWHMIWLKALDTRTEPWEYIFCTAQRKILQEVEALKETCVLDVAAKGGCSITEIGEYLGRTHQRVSQIVINLGLRKLKGLDKAVFDLLDHRYQ